MRYLLAIMLLALIALPAHAQGEGEGLSVEVDREVERATGTSPDANTNDDIEESHIVASSAEPGLHVGDWEGFVTKVIDADTIEIEGERMRLLGVNAPEYEGSNNDCYALEAARQLEKLVLGKLVTYSFDRGYGWRDDHGERRIYLYHDGILVNAWLIRNGFAFVDHSKVYHMKEEFEPLQVKARREHLGFWHACPVHCDRHKICRTQNW